ncbi:MAG: YfiR/HmsC family protein [Bacteroidota bacterium]|nr:YfiR/HmsC family protein [Bacteroidota bacterium]
MKYKLVILVLVVAMPQILNAQRADKESEKRKAEIIYRLPDYLKWKTSDENITVGVLGASKFLLKYLADKETQNYPYGKSFKTRFIQGSHEVSSFDISMLYIGAEYNDEFHDIIETLKNTNTVIITEEWGLKKEVMINLTDKEGWQTFEINPTNLNAVGVNVSTRIKQSDGIIVDDKYLFLQSEKNLEEEREKVRAQTERLKMQKVKLSIQIRKIERQEKKIEFHQKEIKKQQQRIANQRKELELLIKKAKQNKEELAEKIIVLREKEIAIEKQNQKLTAQKIEAGKQKEILDEQKSKIEERQKKIKQQRLEIASQTGIIKTQQNAILIFSVLLGFIIILAFFLFRSSRTQKRQNVKLESQKNEIEIQAVQLEQVNKELEKLSIVASETSNAVAILYPNGKFEWVNTGFTRMYGYTLQLLINERGDNVFDAGNNPKVKEIISKVISKKESLSYESKVITRANKSVWAQTTVSPTVNGEGIVERLVLIDTDITEVKNAEAEIASQNKKITDSILYARRIQKAVLTPKEIISSYLSEHFIMFRPRDIVSGDFYWAAEKEGKLIITAADCTGHGVPGAFMSMLGIAFLNQIIAEHEIENINAGFILDELRSKVKLSLRQTGKAGEAKDGMDMALCIIDREKMQLDFSGAQNPLVLIRNGETKRIKGDDMPIGISYQEESFTNQLIDLEKEDRLYMFSDGYADQFGEKTKKKFYSKRLRMTLEKYHKKSFDEQHKLMELTFDKWKGQRSQMDDVLLIGMKM